MDIRAEVERSCPILPGPGGISVQQTDKEQNPDSKGEFNYYGIMQWTTGDSFIKSTGKGTHKTLADELPKLSKPLMYKIVVDDTEFDPNESFAPYNTGR